MIYRVHKPNQTIPSDNGYGDVIGYVCLCHGNINAEHIVSALKQAKLVQPSWFQDEELFTSNYGCRHTSGINGIALCRKQPRTTLMYFNPIEGQQSELIGTFVKGAKKKPSLFDADYILPQIRLQPQPAIHYYGEPLPIQPQPVQQAPRPVQYYLDVPNQFVGVDVAAQEHPFNPEPAEGNVEHIPEQADAPVPRRNAFGEVLEQARQRMANALEPVIQEDAMHLNELFAEAPEDPHDP